MKAIAWLVQVVTAAMLAFVPAAHANEQQEAEKAAVAILNALDNKQYEVIWNTMTSGWFKSKTTKDSFLAQMTMGRAQLGGSATEKELIDSSFATQDPSSGIKGKIYAFNFKTAYPAGKFYERIVVMQEKDSKFRLSGLWGQPRQ